MPVSDDSTEILVESANRGIAWLSKNIERFAPISLSVANQNIKYFAELSILFYRLKSSADFANYFPQKQSRTTRDWEEFLVSHCCDLSYAELARRNPPNAYAVVLPYLMLRATGFRDNYHEETLANPTCRACIAATESFPHRLLDREYFLWKSGVYQDEPDWSGLYSSTFLAKNRNPIYVSSDSAYSITHTILYVTDWGNRADRLDGAEVNRIVSTIDALLIHYFRVGNYDLVGELLLNRVCFENPFSRIASEVSTGFFEVWRAGECIPRTREAELSQSDKHEETVFTDCYHTTLVGVLYCIAALEWLQRRKRR